MTDVESFAVLEPTADGSGNYQRKGDARPAAELLVDRARQLTLTAPEMTVLVGGLRVLGANVGQSPLGTFTDRPGALTTDFFVNLLGMGATSPSARSASTSTRGVTARDGRGQVDGTAIDLLFGSHSQLRAIAEVYALRQASQGAFVRDFVAAWGEVVDLDRFKPRRVFLRGSPALRGDVGGCWVR